LFVLLAILTIDVAKLMDKKKKVTYKKTKSYFFG